MHQPVRASDYMSVFLVTNWRTRKMTHQGRIRGRCIHSTDLIISCVEVYNPRTIATSPSQSCGFALYQRGRSIDGELVDGDLCQGGGGKVERQED